MQDGRTLRFMFLADGEDPDSLIQKEGRQAFELLIEQALPLSDFLFQHLLSQVDMGNRDSKAKLAQLAIPLISKLPEGVFRQMMKERLIVLLGVDEAGLEKLLPNPQKIDNKDKKQKVTPMRLAISLLLQHPNVAYGLPEFPEFKEMNLPGITLLNSLLEICRIHPNITTGQLLEHWREKPEYKQLNKLAVWQNNIGDAEYEAYFFDTLESFLNSHINNKIEFLKQKERSGEVLTNEERKQLASLLIEQKQH
jgi:DNA primase